MSKPKDSYSDLQLICKDIPLHALNIGVRNKMSELLDPEGFVTETFSNDYTGLAESIGFGYQQIRTLENKRKPTMEVLHQWGLQKELSPTVDELIRHLLAIKRPDVIDECSAMIRQDVQKYEDCHKDVNPVQDDKVTSPQDEDPKESIPLTKQDVDTLEKTGSIEQMYYDGFVIYNPANQSDLNFVKEMVDTLESPDHGLRLFVPWRDDLPGQSRHEITAEIIAKRCRRAIVILSPSFMKSSAADFQLKFAQCLSPGARSKKVVPVFCAPCPMPNILKFVSFVDFTNPGLRDWNWPRLAATLKCPLRPSEEVYMNKEELARIKLNPEGERQARKMFGLGVALADFEDFK